jgi:5-methylcytosine-specific restriction endonuclease McrA
LKLVTARELLNGTPRGHVSQALKRRVWEAADGLCMWCGEEVPPAGPEVDYDHRIPLALNGADDETNLGPIHKRPCHKLKTAQDIGQIAKAKRQRKLIEERTASKRPVKGRGFRKDVTRGFDGRARKR